MHRPPRARVVEHVALCAPALHHLLVSDLALPRATRLYLALALALSTLLLLLPPRRKPPRHTRSCTSDPLGLSPGLLLPALLAPALPPHHHAFLYFTSLAALLPALPSPLERLALLLSPLALLRLRSPAVLVPALSHCLVVALPHVFTPAEAALSAAPALATLTSAATLLPAAPIHAVSTDIRFLSAAAALVRAAAVLVCALAHPVAAAGHPSVAALLVLSICAAAYVTAAHTLPLPPARWLLRVCTSRAPAPPGWASAMPRPVLLAHWTVCVAAAVGLSTPRRGSGCMLTRLPRAVARKFFHAVAAAIFVPGLHYDGALTSLAASGALLALSICEAARAGAFGRRARTAVARVAHGLVDERDGGAVATTHMYLVAACAAPAWVWGSGSGARLVGVIAVCVLDSVAAVFGTRFGHTRWACDSAGRGRSVEGSAAAWAVTSVALRWCGCAQTWGVAIAAGGVATGVEAGTAQIDNLVVAWALCAAVHAFAS